MDIAQRVHEENNVNCLLLELWSSKYKKMAHFLYFLQITVFFFVDSVVFFCTSTLKRLFYSKAR